MSIHRVKYGKLAACGLCIATGLLWLATEANAALTLGSADVGSGWPLQTDSDVLLWTSHLPTGPSDGATDNRGVRSTRFQAQTFKVVDNPISVESIYIGYRSNSGNTDSLPTTFRIIEVDDIGVLYTPGTVTAVTATLSTGVVPANPVTNGFYGLRLDWDGGSPLILAPRTGQQGYAIEIVGAHPDDSPIALLHRANTIPDSVALESVTAGGSLGSGRDFIVAITGQVVPEPATIALSAVALLGCVCVGRRRR